MVLVMDSTLMIDQAQTAAHLAAILSLILMVRFFSREKLFKKKIVRVHMLCQLHV